MDETYALEHFLGLCIEIVDLSVQFLDLLFFCQPDDLLDDSPADVLILKRFCNYDIHLTIRLQTHIAA